jgi:hypothetical protein
MAKADRKNTPLSSLFKDPMVADAFRRAETEPKRPKPDLFDILDAIPATNNPDKLIELCLEHDADIATTLATAIKLNDM